MRGESSSRSWRRRRVASWRGVGVASASSLALVWRWWRRRVVGVASVVVVALT
ncbi:hypothetical protein ACXZ9C_10565 [Streptococcus agalactiae]